MIDSRSSDFVKPASCDSRIKSDVLSSLIRVLNFVLIRFIVLKDPSASADDTASVSYSNEFHNALARNRVDICKTTATIVLQHLHLDFNS